VWRAVYDRLPSSRRARLHLEVADALARLNPGDRSLPDLARHHLAALPLADPVVVIDVTARAAELAMRSLAYEDATELFAALLPIVSSPERRAELLVRAADARVRAGDGQVALDHLREAVALARETRRNDLLVSAAIAFETASWWLGLPGGEAEALLRDALPLVDDEPTRVRALAAYGRALALAGRSHDAERVVEEAIARAREIEAPALMSFALSTFFNVPWQPERYLLMLQRAEELCALAAAQADPLEAMNAQHWLVLSLILNDEFDHLVAALQEHERIANRTRQPFCRHLSAAARSMHALMQGRFAAAEVLANEANELASGLSGVDASGVFGVQMFSLRREQGRLEEVRPVIEMVVRLNRESATWRTGLAALYAELGLVDEARAQVRELVDTGLTGIPRDSLFLGALTYLADAAVATGEQAAAAELYRALEPYRGTPVVLGHLIACYGAADRYLGALAELAGRGRDAETHFLRAVELDTSARAVTWLAHSRYRYAAFLVRQGRGRRSDRARTLLHQVVEVTEEVGMRTLHTRAAGLLAELGEPVPVATVEDGAAFGQAGTLSTREMDVVRCLANGLTNVEIGRHLHISQHTAANHVRSILMKSGLANRTEVAAWAIRNGVASY
jgi:DNA-binding CsgD family transcriptional regulator/tetratricopeptide (TPR) repeat protein